MKLLKQFLRESLILMLVFSVAVQPTLAQVATADQETHGTQTTLPAVPATKPAISEVIKMSFFEVTRISELFNYGKAELDEAQKQFKAERDATVKKLKTHNEELNLKIKNLEADLKKLPQTNKDPQVVAQRKKIQCQIRTLHKDIIKTIKEQRTAKIDLEFKEAKLDILEKWPSVHKKIEEDIASGAIAKRRYGNVMDIGFRGNDSPFKGQEKDIEVGKKSIESAKAYGLLPKEVDAPEVKAYIEKIVGHLRENSDVKVPLVIYLIDEKNDYTGERIINAFALPGGFVFIETGLFLEAKNESQFTGVVAHEISHVAARHSYRLMRKVNITQMAMFAVQIALSYLIPGLYYFTSYGSYLLKRLLLQAIYSALELAFGLPLLGVSRDYESEADQLGIQYMTKAGYDPKGFMEFFDAVGHKKGYVAKTSFLATHPAFADREFQSIKEIKALESAGLYKEGQGVVDSPEFHKMQEMLRATLDKQDKKAKKEDKNNPTILKPEEREDYCSGENNPSETAPSTTTTTTTAPTEEKNPEPKTQDPTKNDPTTPPTSVPQPPPPAHSYCSAPAF